jgi:hypothetical protein
VKGFSCGGICAYLQQLPDLIAQDIRKHRPRPAVMMLAPERQSEDDDACAHGDHDEKYHSRGSSDRSATRP